MAAATAVCAARRGVALAFVTVVVVLTTAAAAAWGAPAGAGTTTPATAARADAATAGLVEAAGAGVADVDSMVSLRAPSKRWVKGTIKEGVKPASKQWVNPVANKWTQPAVKRWTEPVAEQAVNGRVKPVSRARAAKGGSSPSRGGCSTVLHHLKEFYTLSWGLAMLDPTAGRAFGIFLAARGHAAAYRVMSRAERAAMARVLRVPLQTGVPKYMLPKRVPMIL
ncbi:hypothetical protein I4F81_003134 [Pyropia yezoensis]|uniref:Uncharacterized protein n=1 Tax=Pyropia yezoensis TaxID=2788 RepID=A0ACC3BRH0_PYRYE|nr:hypothetical protein I4F81_003134 [Neopyropia yezoensis]